MDKQTMLIGYDMNLFEQKFNENANRVGNFMFNYFNATIGEIVAGMNIEQNLLYAWAYYFTNITDENPQVGNQIMIGMINHFTHMINSDDKVDIRGNKNGGYLLLDETFCANWFRASVCGMLGYLYGEENVEKLHNYLEENYYSKNEKFRSLMLKQPDPQ